MIEAAKRHAAADPTDPFAYQRALAHLRLGILEPLTKKEIPDGR